MSSNAHRVRRSSYRSTAGWSSSSKTTSRRSSPPPTRAATLRPRTSSSTRSSTSATARSWAGRPSSSSCSRARWSTLTRLVKKSRPWHPDRKRSQTLTRIRTTQTKTRRPHPKQQNPKRCRLERSLFLPHLFRFPYLSFSLLRSLSPSLPCSLALSCSLPLLTYALHIC